MIVNVYLPFLVAMVAPATCRRLAYRLDPRTATWLLTAVAAVTACCTTAALGALTLVGLARIPVLAGWVALSAPTVVRLDPTPGAVTAVAVVLLAGSLGGAVAGARHRYTALRRAARQVRRWSGGRAVVRVADPAPYAYAVPGGAGRVVVSTGMLASVGRDGRRVLLAHERAHLRHRHHRFATVARIAAAANPLLRPLESAIGYTIERWADESAARAVGDRRVVATTIARAALAGRTPEPALPGIAAGPVPRRVAALLTAPPRRGPARAATLVAVAAGTCMSTFDALTDAHTLLTLAAR